MKRYRNKAFRFNQDLDKAYRRLFRPSNKAGCTICGEDEPSVLDIHESDDSHDFKVLCCKCRCRVSAKNNITREGAMS